MTVRRQNYASDTNIYLQYQLNNFFIVKILIHSATFTDFFCANSIIFLGDLEENKRVF